MSDWQDDDEAWTDEEFGWDASDDDDAPTETVSCRHCGQEIYADAERCPRCGEPVEAAWHPVWVGKPAWYILLGLLGIIAVIVALSGIAAWW